MAETIVARKYAKALLEAAKGHNSVEGLLAEVKELQEAIEICQAQSYFTEQIVPDEQKTALLNEIAAGTSLFMGNFLKLIAENGRYALLSESLKEFVTLANHALGRDEVEVISTIPLTKAQEDKMANIIKEKFKLKNVTIVNQLNAGILGGFIIKNDAKVLDASIKSQLAKIAVEL
ncbi:F0F1 ATP synthase subunit delta [Lactovum odontotermitis]